MPHVAFALGTNSKDGKAALMVEKQTPLCLTKLLWCCYFCLVQVKGLAKQLYGLSSSITLTYPTLHGSREVVKKVRTKKGRVEKKYMPTCPWCMRIEPGSLVC